MKNRHLLKKIKDIRNIVHRIMKPQPPLEFGTLGPHTVLPITISCPVVFPESHQWSEISSLSKVIWVLGKARRHRAPNLGCSRAGSPGWFDVSQKNSARDVMHKQAHCHDEVANHQLPIAKAFWVIWIVSRGRLKSYTKFDADLLLYSLSHFECDNYTVHMLTLWPLLPPTD